MALQIVEPWKQTFKYGKLTFMILIYKLKSEENLSSSSQTDFFFQLIYVCYMLNKQGKLENISLSTKYQQKVK